ncbi:hypothetical protein R1sor_002496 [Riccia sorocarpa]|uniref:Integrase catalytic domain-containing protein n=1 Tax=Riccia sorocarpa TaxID=122646 RepID=A0ABD3H2X5_9MARC
MAGIATGAGATSTGGGVGAGTSTAVSATTPPTTAPGVVPPPTDMIGVLQSLATLIRAQPVGEMRSTKALESCVQKMRRFVGREVSHYLREYRCAMEMYSVSDTETIANFELVSEPELRDRIREIARRYLIIPGGWESFERAMREEYLDEDSDRITRRTFLDWIETQPGRTLGLSELKREFERRYSQLPLRERLTFDTRRTELFLRAVDDVSTDRLCFMLADRAAEGGITSDWLRVDEAVSVLTKQRRAVGIQYVAPADFPRVVEPRVEFPPRVVPQVPLMAPSIAPAAMPVQPRPEMVPQQPIAAPLPAAIPVAAPRQQPVGNRDQQNAIDDLTRQLRELKVEVAGLRQGPHVPAAAAPARPRDGPRRCIWCDSVDHMRAECTELAAAVRDRVVHYQDGRLHLTATGEPLMTKWGRGGMRSFLPRPAGAGVVVAVPPDAVAAPVHARAVVPLHEANVFAGQAISASSGSSSTASSKVSVEVLRRGAESIRRATGWNDFVDVNTIYAFLDNKKHVTWEDAIVEEKRRRDEAETDTGPFDTAGPRVTRRRGGDIAADVPSSSRAPPPPPGPMEGVWHDVPVKGKAQKASVQEKNKAPAYKLAADIETSTDLKAILEKGILDARVEFSLRDILGIAKREFHELIIDVIKRKRQTVSEQVASQMTRVADDTVVDAVYDAAVCVGEGEVGEEYVVLVAGPATIEATEEDEEKGHVQSSDYKSEFWARATDEVKVQLGGLAEPVTALVDTGSEINVMSRAVYERGQWPIDLHHGWAFRSANGVKKEMYGACHFIPVRIGNVEVTQHFFVQENAPIPVILGQPYITAVRLETKVLNDGSHFARIRSLDDLFTPVERDNGSGSLAANIPFEQKTGCTTDVKNWRSGVVVCSVDSYSSFQRMEDLKGGKKTWLERQTEKLRCIGVLSSEECISAEVHAKYKFVLKKVKPVATQLPEDSEQLVELAAKQPDLRDVRRIGHKFTPETLMKLKIGGDDFLTDCEKKKFEEMIRSYEKAFSFSTEEIGCVDPKVIAPMVIFTVPHVPWDLKPIPFPRAMLPKLINLLKEKMRMGILEPSMAPYSSRWFTVPKKNGSLHFIQDLQPANSVTIRNVGTGPIIDDVVDEFAGRAIYSVGDLYSGYDQFQLAVESRDLTTIRTPLGLMRMCTLPQGATNSVAHMQNAMHKVLREFVPEITIPFLDDIPMKGCATEEKDETLDATGCRKFVSDHIRDVGKILNRLREVREYLYSGRLSDIGFYLSSLEKREDWSDAEFKKIRQKAYGFLLREEYLWKRPKRRDGEFLRVVDDEDTKLELLRECHEALWTGHRGVWATYMKLKERYWWKGMYSDVDKFVGSCLHCQFYSKVRHRDGLIPTFPPSIHFRWVLDLVKMPPGLWGMRYLVLAREDLSNFVEGRALRTKSVEGICRFVLEDIVCRYGSVGSLRADRGDLNAEEARTFFRRYGVDLKLTTAMNPEGIGKSERGHPPIVHALKPILPIEDSVFSWVSLPWEDGVDRETLLAWRIRQLERREEDLADVQEKLKQARLKNKSRFDKTHRLRPKPIQPGDWVLVYEITLENQHSTVRKFSRRWFGPFVVLVVNDNATYSLRELDGTILRLAVARKRVKLFKKRDNTCELFDFLDLEHGPAEDDYADEENAAEEEEDED